MKKPEVIQIMRARALKHSDMANHSEALRYIERAEKLAEQMLQTQDHVQVLLVKQTWVEIKLK